MSTQERVLDELFGVAPLKEEVHFNVTEIEIIFGGALRDRLLELAFDLPQTADANAVNRYADFQKHHLDLFRAVKPAPPLARVAPYLGKWFEADLGDVTRPAAK